MRGNPARWWASRPAGGVYPRVCGGTYRRTPVYCTAWGLSPRMRGNPISLRSVIVCLRSIPAYAGEPHTAPDRHRGASVYPRVCGGTVGADGALTPWRGLSPRMRGNPVLLVAVAGPLRSIPAYAGEPTSSGISPALVAVYPRVCGGTYSMMEGIISACGLSPRMRGNLTYLGCAAFSEGSIPAYAGEPSQSRC